MAFDPIWIEVPRLLDDDELARVLPGLRDAGLAFTLERVRVSDAPLAPRRFHDPERTILRLRRDQSEAATAILGEALDLEDPDQVRPFSGPCPSCGAKLERAWSCPSCELGFRPRFERDDPMIAFVRENGGFRGG